MRSTTHFFRVFSIVLSLKGTGPAVKIPRSSGLSVAQGWRIIIRGLQNTVQSTLSNMQITLVLYINMYILTCICIVSDLLCIIVLHTVHLSSVIRLIYCTFNSPSVLATLTLSFHSHCTVLYCTVLYCIIVYCTLLYCTI